jgi:hypothetical protein
LTVGAGVPQRRAFIGRGKLELERQRELWRSVVALMS